MDLTPLTRIFLFSLSASLAAIGKKHLLKSLLDKVVDFRDTAMHWIFFHQPLVPQDVNEKTLNDSDALSDLNDLPHKPKRFLKALSPYKLNNDDFAQLAPLLPFVLILTILFILLLIIGFRRWPGMMAGIVAGCLTSASIYLIMSAIAGDMPQYE